VHEIIADMEGRGEKLRATLWSRRLNKINPGEYFISISPASRKDVGSEIGVLSAPLPPTSLIAIWIDRCAVQGVESAIEGISDAWVKMKTRKVIRSGY
jgi:hypothetical protein